MTESVRKMCSELVDRFYWQYDQITVDREMTDGAFVTIRQGDTIATLVLKETMATVCKSVYRHGKYNIEKYDYTDEVETEGIVKAVQELFEEKER